MLERILWNENAEPVNGVSISRVLYDIRRDDGAEGLIFDAVSVNDILEEAEEIVALDALTSPYSKLERKMQIMARVMNRAGTTVKVDDMELTKPFKRLGVVQVAAIFRLSDGQSVTIYFHNPDTTPSRLAATDIMISWKWLLNKKDITIVGAPEHGEDLDVNEVVRRVMKLADKNSDAFTRANQQRAEREQRIQSAKTEVATLEKELNAAERDLEVSQVAYEDAQARYAKAQKDAESARIRREAEQKEREEAERRAAEEAARQAAEKAEAERKAQEEAEAARKAEEEERAKKEAEEAERRAAQEAQEAQAAQETPSAEPASEPQPEPAPEAPQQPETAEDAQWLADEAVLQKVIDGTHPQIDDPALADVIEAIYNRWAGNEERLAKVNQAIDAWADYQLKMTENLV